MNRLELWSRLARPNAMIKVPATAAGIPAIEELTVAGVNTNVTLPHGEVAGPPNPSHR